MTDFAFVMFVWLIWLFVWSLDVRAAFWNWREQREFRYEINKWDWDAQ